MIGVGVGVGFCRWKTRLLIAGRFVFSKMNARRRRKAWNLDQGGIGFYPVSGSAVGRHRAVAVKVLNSDYLHYSHLVERFKMDAPVPAKL